MIVFWGSILGSPYVGKQYRDVLQKAVPKIGDGSEDDHRYASKIQDQHEATIKR